MRRAAQDIAYKAFDAPPTALARRGWHRHRTHLEPALDATTHRPSRAPRCPHPGPSTAADAWREPLARGSTPAFSPQAATGSRGLAGIDPEVLEHSIERCGGWISGEDLAERLQTRCEAPLSTLARWIATGQVLSRSDGARTRLPLFQFDLADLTLRPGLRELIAELSPAYQGGEILDWFATPNLWMDGALPLDRIAEGFEPLLPVARADRFIATGW